MRRLHIALSALILLLGSLLILWLSQLETITPTQALAEQEENAEEHSEDEKVGPKGGILLGQEQAIQLELKTNTVAKGQLEFEFYAYQSEKNIPLTPENLKIEWQRLDKVSTMKTQLLPPGGLKSQESINEPHSFEMRLFLKLKDNLYQYHWENFEARVSLTPDQIKENQIRFETVKALTLSTEVQLPGKIAVDQDREAHVSPRVSGVVETVYKHLGDTVKRGDILARLNSRELGDIKEEFQTQQIRYQQADEFYRLEQGFQKHTQALLNALAAGQPLAKIHQKILDTPIGDDRSRLVQAYTEFELAESNYQRESKLNGLNATTRLELQQAHKRYLDSKAAYKGLIEEIDRQRRLQVLAKKAALDQLKPALERARNQLKVLGLAAGDNSTFYDLRSPINGVLISKHIAPGESVLAQSSAFSLADLSGVWAEMMIPESQLEQVRIGASVVVESQAGSRRQSGHISHLGSVVDENSRTAEAHAEIPNSDRFWKPGMFVTLKLQTHPTPVKMAVKSSAIQFLNEEPFVFVRSGDQIQGFPVVTGLETSEWIEIKSGLQTGQSYVAENAYVIKAELEKSSAAHSH